MQRYFLQLSYSGTHYHGWQIQPNGITIQAVLEEALSRILNVPVSLTGCGRTDAGVHARIFFAHFDLEAHLSQDQAIRLIYRLNNYLPDDIVVFGLRPVKPEVHARFTALQRTYQYFITTVKDPFAPDKSWYFKYGILDQEKLDQGAAILLEYTDFECFSKRDSDIVGTQCKLFTSEWERSGSMLIYTVSANRFLRNMVRAIVGTLVEMGKGKWDEDRLRLILSSKDRCMAGESVPASGLFLTGVTYPEDIYLD